MVRLIGNRNIAIPNLATLNITVPVLPLEMERQRSQVLEIPESATNLHSVVFFVGELRTDTFIFPWAQLTTLSVFGYVHICECLEILYLCPNLSSLSFHDIRGTLVEGRHSNTHALLSNLTNLTLSVSCDGAALLDHLILPSLRQAHLLFHTLESLQRELTSIMSMFHRSSCPLSELHLWGRYVLEEHLVELVQCIPTMQELQATYNDMDHVSDRIYKMLETRSKGYE